MLTSLELTNFRAFRNEAFAFSKLNIFVGPNNSGKSSVISSLNMLAQSIPLNGLVDGPVTINGQYDQLGTFKDMVHGGRASTPIKIGLTVEDYRYEFEIKYRLQRREMEIPRFKLVRGKKPVFEYTSTRDSYSVLIGGKDSEALFPKVRKSRPRMTAFLPRLPEVLREIRLSTSRVTRELEQQIALIRSVETDISRFRNRAIRTFGNYDSLGAFREMPQRTYLWSGESAESIGRFGQNTVTILASDSLKRGTEQVGYVDQVSEWLRATGIAKGIKVKHLTDRHFELVVVGNDGLDHNIADVGFGCSQVLPVLICGMKAAAKRRSTGLSPTSLTSFGRSTVVVQEPEIHLHPNAQAELGSFFANLSQAGPQIFLETHSDSLVLRVARHVASGEIPSADVKIFYVQDVDGQKSVTPMSINEGGGFTPEWPGGFFPQRQAESFALAKAAMSARKKVELGK